MDAGMTERGTASAARTSCDRRGRTLVRAGSFIPLGASHPGVSSVVTILSGNVDSAGGMSGCADCST
eukprot:3281139-Amphidinium_carterae.2